MMLRLEKHTESCKLSADENRSNKGHSRISKSCNAARPKDKGENLRNRWNRPQQNSRKSLDFACIRRSAGGVRNPNPFGPVEQTRRTLFESENVLDSENVPFDLCLQTERRAIANADTSRPRRHTGCPGPMVTADVGL
jgi:hypothetical protein